MHAAEKALKAHLILGGGLPWMKLEHRAFSQLGGTNARHVLAPLWHPVLQGGLAADVEALEELTPDRQGQMNPEYPFLELIPGDASIIPPDVTLRLPGTYFNGTRSLQCYQMAYRVVTMVRTLTPQFQGVPGSAH